MNPNTVVQELRYQIYQLVLSIPSSLHVRRAPGVSRAWKKSQMIEACRPEREFNQIKFVNKQLYRETAALEAKFNRITFDGPVLQAAIRHCLRFLRQRGSNRIQWLKTIVVTEYPERGAAGPYNTIAMRGTTPYLKGNMKLILQLLALGAATSHLDIHLRLKSWIIGDLANFDSLDTNLFLEIGMGLVLLFRIKDITHVMPYKGDQTLQLLLDKNDYIMGKQASVFRNLHLRAPNVRIFPTFAELDENAFRMRVLQDWNETAQDPTLLPPNGVDVWVEYVRHWLSHGI